MNTALEKHGIPIAKEKQVDLLRRMEEAAEWAVEGGAYVDRHKNALMVGSARLLPYDRRNWEATRPGSPAKQLFNPLGNTEHYLLWERNALTKGEFTNVSSARKDGIVSARVRRDGRIVGESFCRWEAVARIFATLEAASGEHLDPADWLEVL